MKTFRKKTLLLYKIGGTKNLYHLSMLTLYYSQSWTRFGVRGSSQKATHENQIFPGISDECRRLGKSKGTDYLQHTSIYLSLWVMYNVNIQFWILYFHGYFRICITSFHIPPCRFTRLTRAWCWPTSTAPTLTRRMRLTSWGSSPSRTTATTSGW